MDAPVDATVDYRIPEIQVMIPSALRALCNGQGLSRLDGLRLAATDVRGLLAELARQHPQVHVRLCDERGEPRPHINVFVNDDHVRARAGLETPLTAGDVVTILPAVSGG
jgi:molybdopterin converting factor small subunit